MTITSHKIQVKVKVKAVKVEQAINSNSCLITHVADKEQHLHLSGVNVADHLMDVSPRVTLLTLEGNSWLVWC